MKRLVFTNWSPQTGPHDNVSAAGAFGVNLTKFPKFPMACCEIQPIQEVCASILVNKIQVFYLSVAYSVCE